MPFYRPGDAHIALSHAANANDDQSLSTTRLPRIGLWSVATARHTHTQRRNRAWSMLLPWRKCTTSTPVWASIHFPFPTPVLDMQFQCPWWPRPQTKHQKIPGEKIRYKNNKQIKQKGQTLFLAQLGNWECTDRLETGPPPSNSVPA